MAQGHLDLSIAKRKNLVGDIAKPFDCISASLDHCLQNFSAIFAKYCLSLDLSSEYMIDHVWKPEQFWSTFEDIEQHFRHAAIVTKHICDIHPGWTAVPEDDESLKEIIFRALPRGTRKGLQEKMKMGSTSTTDINIGNFDFGWVKETCRIVESELRTRSASKYYPRPLNSLQIEGGEEVTDPTPAADAEVLNYASDRFSRKSSLRTRSPPRFPTPARVSRGRSPSIKPRGTARRPGDPIHQGQPRSRSTSTTRNSARVHAIIAYDPVKNLDACLNCGNSGHRVADCKQPKDENRIRSNMDLFQKHRKQLVATVNAMQMECSSLINQYSVDHPETSEGEESDFSLHTGDTTDAEDTDQDETEDEGSDLEHDQRQDEHGCAKDRGS